MKTAVALLTTISIAACALPLPRAIGSSSRARRASPERSCGWKEDRIGNDPVKTGYLLGVRRVSCRHAHGMAFRFFQSRELPAGWHARYVHYGQELYLCRARPLRRCVDGRHVHVRFPDAQ